MSSSGHDDATTTDAPSSAASTAAATASSAATPADDAIVNPDVASVEPGAMSAAGQHIANCYRSATTIVALFSLFTSGYATWFTAGGAIRISHYDVIDDVITRKL